MSGVFCVTMFRARDCIPCASKAAIHIRQKARPLSSRLLLLLLSYGHPAKARRFLCDRTNFTATCWGSCLKRCSHQYVLDQQRKPAGGAVDELHRLVVDHQINGSLGALPPALFRAFSLLQSFADCMAKSRFSCAYPAFGGGARFEWVDCIEKVIYCSAGNPFSSSRNSW